MTPPFWLAELKSSGVAPDHEIRIDFSSTGDRDLRKMIRALPLNLYRPTIDLQTNCDIYISGPDYDGYVAALKGDRKKSFSNINLITVSKNHLSIFHGCGGSELREYAEEEMQIVNLVLTDPALVISQWTIDDTGDGVKGKIHRTGLSKGDLVDYLKSISCLA